MRSRVVATKFHHTKRGPSGSPPSNITRAGPAAVRIGSLPGIEHDQRVQRQGFAIEVELSADRKQRALDVVVGNAQARVGDEVQRHIQRSRQDLHRRYLAEGVAGHDTHGHALTFDHGQAGFRVVREGRFGVLVFGGQRDPGLQSVEGVVDAAQTFRRAFGMHDAASRGHPVDIAGLDFLHRAEAVAVHHRALPQVGHGGQADMRMRAHRDRLLAAEHRRPDVVEEHERTDAAPIGTRQDPADGESAEVVQARTVEFGHGVDLRGIGTMMPRVQAAGVG